MEKRYRSDYDGEFVIINTVWRNGRKEQQREWIENPIETHLISPRAVVISSGDSRSKFPIKRLEGHKGGLLGKLRMQSYGCNGCWEELQCDFYVSIDNEELQAIKQAEYDTRVAVYTTSRKCVENPGHFYLIPYFSGLSAVASALYLAAFDQHSEVYIVGVDGKQQDDKPDHKEIASVMNIIQTYNEVQWIFINNGPIPSQWKEQKNVKHWDYDKFVSYCDV